MTNSNHNISTEEVQTWWEENPFTLGVATKNYRHNDLVGRIPIKEMDLRYFEEIERKFRKHSGIGGQAPDEPLISKLVNYDNQISGKKVLDVATGSGLFAVSFAKAGADVTAIDLTNFAVEQTARNLKLRDLKAVVVQMDAQKMKFPDKCFHFVNAWGCLMHMPDTDRAIREIYRVLMPGGHALAYMYNKDSWPFWFNIFFLRGILLVGLFRFRGNIRRLTSRYSDGSHQGGNVLTKFFTPNEVRVMFKHAGFAKVEVFPWDIGYEPNHWPMRSFPIFRFLPKRMKSWMSKRFGYGLIVKATK